MPAVWTGRLISICLSIFLAIQLTSIGNSVIAIDATTNSDAETKIGPFAFAAAAPPADEVVAILMTGARMPVMRLKAEQTASPVPR